MKKLYSLFLLCGAILTAPIPSYGWWLWVTGYPVQEGTQLQRLSASINEISEQLEMLQQHLAMLKSLKSQLMQLGTGQIMEVFTEAQSILKQAQSLTSGVSDFGAAFKEHFPDEYEKITSVLNEGKRLSDSWRKVEEGYLKTLNMTAKNFDNEQAVRDRMLQTLTEADSDSGQTKAIQVIGAMVNHAAFLLDRNNQELGGFMENYLTRQQIERERKRAAQQNVVEMGRNAAQMERPGQTYKPGFK